MTAFEAKWFVKTYPEGAIQNRSTLDVSPLRFRYEENRFWDSSECCLIHADLTYLRHGPDVTTDSGIYTNPYIRVAYDSRTLSWLRLTRRVERLYSSIHNMPHSDTRRLERPGDEVVENDVRRIARPGRFCGGRTLQVLNEHPKPGEKKWAAITLPAPPR